MRRMGFAILVLPAWVLLSAAGCPVANPVEDEAITQSDKSRDLTPKVNDADLAELVAGNNALALGLYNLLDKNDNFLFSPHSVSIALAMTYAGAQGQTESQMAQALHYTLPHERLHPAFNALDLALVQRAQASDGSGFQLAIANRIWTQQDYSFLPQYLDTLAVNYGVGLGFLDFRSDPGGSADAINAWVGEQTNQLIKDVVSPAAMNSESRLVLTNAVYFKADWDRTFAQEDTRPEAFHLNDGRTVTVPMMHQTRLLGYTSCPDYQAVQLPYAGGQVAMIILLPAEGKLESIKQILISDGLKSILEQVDKAQRVQLHVPKFSFASSFELIARLRELGMVDAFSSGKADFSGMNGKRDLFLDAVIHKAFVKVDERGTEAAAATAVVGMDGSAEPASIEMVVNRPFLFLIRDVPTNAILFMGKVANPS